MLKIKNDFRSTLLKSIGTNHQCYGEDNWIYSYRVKYIHGCWCRVTISSLRFKLSKKNCNWSKRHK